MANIKPYVNTHSELSHGVIKLYVQDLFTTSEHFPNDREQGEPARIMLEQVFKIIDHINNMFDADFITTAIQFNMESLRRQSAMVFRGNYTHISVDGNSISIEIQYKDRYHFFKLDSHTDVVVMEVTL